jgi:16S rRNA (cytosine1402-N4)-methyltransferase
VTPPGGFHEPVLLREVLRFLITDPAQTYVDATAGGGGHSAGIARALAPGGRIVCLDADEDALEHARTALIGAPALFVHGNFRELRVLLGEHDIGSIGGLLFDLGVSSHQLNTGARGFSFRFDEPLDMRMDRRQALHAGHVVNEYPQERLERVFADYGEERRARAVARAVVAARPLTTTGDLRAAVTRVAGGRFLVKTLARIFQGIRIEVNAELNSLAAALRDGAAMLVPGGHMVVIAYHSLEDRIVKQFFRGGGEGMLRPVTTRAVMPDEDECTRNPRARSARLRAAERV